MAIATPCLYSMYLMMHPSVRGGSPFVFDMGEHQVHPLHHKAATATVFRQVLNHHSKKFIPFELNSVTFFAKVYLDNKKQQTRIIPSCFGTNVTVDEFYAGLLMQSYFILFFLRGHNQ